MNKTDSDVVSDTATKVKPKRVLTEAQRLAFLKGREKRMANIERKRQEKIEAEQETKPDMEITPPEPIPSIARETTTVTETIITENQVNDGQEVKDNIHNPEDVSDSMKVEKLADLILDRIKTLKSDTVKSADPIIEPPRQRKKYTKRPRDVAEEEVQQEIIHSRTFNWM